MTVSQLTKVPSTLGLAVAVCIFLGLHSPRRCTCSFHSTINALYKWDSFKNLEHRESRSVGEGIMFQAREPEYI